MPINPLIPLSGNPPVNIDIAGAMARGQQMRAQQQETQLRELQLQQEQEQQAARSAVNDLLTQTNGDVEKAATLAQTHPMLGVKLWGQQTLADMAGRRTAQQKAALDLSKDEEGVKNSRLGDARRALAGLDVYPNERPKDTVPWTETTGMRDVIEQAMRQIGTAPDKEAELATARAELTARAQNGDLAASELLRIIGDAGDGGAAVKNLNEARASYLSPREQQYRKVMGSQTLHAQRIVPSDESSDFNPATALGLDPTQDYNPQAVEAALAGSPEEKAVLDERAAKETAARTATNAGFDLADKANKYISEAGYSVTSPAQVPGFVKTLSDMGAPASVIARVPTTKDPKQFAAAWSRFLDSTRTEQERQQGKLEQERIGLQRESQSQGDIDADSPDALAAIDGLSSFMAKTGTMPTGFRVLGKNAGKFLMKVAALAHQKELQNGIDMAEANAQFGADKASLISIQKTTDAVRSFMNTADLNADELKERLGGLWDSGSPVFNAPLRDFQSRWAGDPKMGPISTYLASVQNEYGKIINAAGMNAALTDSARHEAQQLLDPNATVAQMLGSIKALRTEGSHRIKSNQDMLKEIRGRIRNGPTGADPVPYEIRQSLAGQRPGHYTMTDGSVWTVLADGTIEKGSK